VEPVAAILITVVALVLGLGVGWVLAGRSLAPLRAERDRLDERARAADLGRATAEAKASAADLLRTTLAAVERERNEAQAKLAAAAERERGYEARLAELRDAREALAAQFGEVGGRMLGEAQKAFLERADQRFAQAEERSGDRLKALLQPVESTLKRYEEGLKQVEKDRVESYAGLRQAVEELGRGNEVVRREAARLADVMRSSPKARGRWGEEQLRTILEGAGLAENVDFTQQTSVSDGERQLRPDFVINLPGDRCIVVDVKCPLVAFEAAFDEEDEGRRAQLLMDHARAMKAYAADLGRKGYWKQFDRSPDFVILFVPGEHFLSAAAERMPDLIETAFRNGVIIASTINMLALAKVMAGMWRQERIAEQAREIGENGRKLHGALAVMGGHIVQLGKRIEGVNGAYNSFIGSLEGNVWPQAKRFEAMEFLPGDRKLDDLAVVSSTVRPLVRLPSGGGAAADDGPIEAAAE
jgi:DNA recombination protein RmuC